MEKIEEPAQVANLLEENGYPFTANYIRANGIELSKLQEEILGFVE